MRVSQENWMVGDRVCCGMLMGQTDEVGTGWVIQEVWVVGGWGPGWGGMLVCQTGGVDNGWVNQDGGWARLEY